jgi:hypothetical protein
VWAGAEYPDVDPVDGEAVEAEAAAEVGDREGAAEDQPQDGDAEDKTVPAEEEKVVEKRAFRGSDYELRKPLEGSIDFEKYSKFKEIEDKILALNGLKENLKAYVIASGVQYGQGENALVSVFKAAWLGGDGVVSKGLSSSIPMIHGSDIASMIKTLSSGESQEAYHIAADSKPVAEADLLQAILDTLSEPRAVAEDKNAERAPELDAALSVNINVQPSSILMSEEFESAAPGGILESVKNVANQFCESNSLKPIKVLIAGETSTEFANIISSHFNVPVVKGDNVDDLKALLSSNVCSHRGYVLQAEFPQGANMLASKEQAQALFFPEKNEPVEGGEEELSAADADEKSTSKVFFGQINQILLPSVVKFD